MSIDAETIYALLPAVYRVRDADNGGKLKALIGVIAQQAAILDADLDQLYDDLFIETCAPWVVPYIGDLIGYRPLNGTSPNVASPRADVANTIGYRRRKGTLGAVEKLAYDVTGWPAVAVEFFTILATTQHMNHIRPQNARVDVRSWRAATDIGSAFDVLPRTAEMRRIASRRGRYNIPNIGVFVWRLMPFGGATLRQAPPSQLGTTPTVSTAKPIADGAYTFDPFGDDVPLINPPPAPDKTLFTLLARRNVPEPLRRRVLFDEIEALHRDPNATATYFASPPAFTVHDAGGTPLTNDQIEICDLSTWSQPTAAGIVAAVDPQLGRIRFAAPTPAPDAVIAVSYAYAFSGPFGGGTYARPADAGEAAPVPPQGATMAATDFTTLTQGVHEVSDSGTQEADVTLTPAALTPPAPLVIHAADYARPILGGKLTINAAPGTAVTFRGLGVAGDVEINGTGEFTLRLEHCTVRGAIKWNAAGGGSIVLDHCLCGPMDVDDAVAITVADSAVDGGDDAQAAIAGVAGKPCGGLSIARSTIIGTIDAREIGLIENSIITGVVTSARRQQGCVRYSFLPFASTTPSTYRCQPSAAIENAAAKATTAGNPPSKAEYDAIVASVCAWLKPLFTDRARSKPGYLQLADACAPEIAAGAEGSGEMGIFNTLETARREANLVYRLSEYLRIGLDSGVIHAS